MEVYRAKHDYEKEREDILSFRQGDTFHVASKADKKWWAAYSQKTGEYGYVPSSYMEVSMAVYPAANGGEEPDTSLHVLW